MHETSKSNRYRNITVLLRKDSNHLHFLRLESSTFIMKKFGKKGFWDYPFHRYKKNYKFDLEFKIDVLLAHIFKSEPFYNSYLVYIIDIQEIQYGLLIIFWRVSQHGAVLSIQFNIFDFLASIL